MITLTIIVVYLLIGALIGVNEGDTLDEIEDKAKEELDGFPLWTLKLSLMTASLFIMVVAPVLELYYVGNKCISKIKR